MKKITTISFVDFRKNLSECVNLTKYKSERFLITKNGKTVGAFVPVEDLNQVNLLNSISTPISAKELTNS